MVRDLITVVEANNEIDVDHNNNNEDLDGFSDSDDDMQFLLQERSTQRRTRPMTDPISTTIIRSNSSSLMNSTGTASIADRMNSSTTNRSETGASSSSGSFYEQQRAVQQVLQKDERKSDGTGKDLVLLCTELVQEYGPTPSFAAAISTLQLLRQQQKQPQRQRQSQCSRNEKEIAQQQNEESVFERTITMLKVLLISQNGDFWHSVVDSNQSTTKSIMLLDDTMWSTLLSIPSLICHIQYKLPTVILPYCFQNKQYHKHLLLAVWRHISCSTTNSSNNITTQGGTTISYALVQRLLRRRQGQDVAGALFYYYHHDLNLEPAFNADTATDWDTIEMHISSSTFASNSQPPAQFLWLQELIPREASILCRAILLQSLKVMSRQQATGNSNMATTTNNIQQRLPNIDWIDWVCQPLLQNHSSSICQWIIEKTPYQPQLDPDNMLLLTQFVKLLGRTQYHCNQLKCISDNMDSDDDDDDDDDDDEEEEEEDNVEQDTKTTSLFVTPILKQDKLLYRTLCYMARIWSQVTFVRRAGRSVQNQTTFFLVFGLEQLHQLDVSSTLGHVLMLGITERLGSTISHVRQNGLQVAQTWARRLGKDIQFDELISDCSNNNNKNHYNNGHEKKSISITDEQNESNVTSLNGRSRLNEEDGSSDDSDWDDDGTNINSNLTPYTLDDDQEDLLDVPRPLYLNECLDYLRCNPESDEYADRRHETCLREMPRLVRSRPADLTDLGPELARSVLRLENFFGIDEFGDLVADALLALLSQDPLTVGLNLIEELFQDGSLKDRVNVLAALEASAEELSGLTLSKTNHAVVSVAQRLERPRVSGKRSLVQSSSTSALDRTRRWGKRGCQSIIANRFGEVASVWFYALVGNFLKHKADPHMWNGSIGAQLLSNLFLTLSRVVECTGPFTPGIDMLAKDLLELVWSFRHAEIPEIRAAVLYAVNCSIPLLSEHALLSLLFDSSTEGLVPSLSHMMENDPDEDCRNLASMMSKNVSTTLTSMNHSQFLL